MKRIFIIVLFILLCVGVSEVAAVKKSRPMRVLIRTTMGDIKVELYDDTPNHRDNFIKLVKENFYDSVLFHRVISDFMIQAGDPNSKEADSLTLLGSGDLGYKIDAEIIYPSHFHKKGALAAARQGDIVNPDKKSSASQFYIVQGKTYTDEELSEIERKLTAVMKTNVPFKFTDIQRRYYKTFGGAPHLDGQYTVFGEVVGGLDVVQAISTVETNQNDRPKADVIILDMKVVKK